MNIELKTQIEAGQCPTLVDASHAAGAPCLGDLLPMGFVTRHRNTDRYGDVVDISWRNVSPHPILVGETWVRSGEFI